MPKQSFGLLAYICLLYLFFNFLNVEQMNNEQGMLKFMLDA